MPEKIATLAVFLFLTCTLASAAGECAPRKFVAFKEAEETALRNSYQIAAQKYVVEAARDRAFAQEVKRLPTIGFNAESTFLSKVGRIEIPSSGINQEVGEHLNWSIGPMVNWVVWDTGQIVNKAKSIKSTADAEDQNLEYDRRQVLLNARAAYIGVQLAKEQVRLINESLRLARAQYDYVLEKKRAGTADLFDLTVAHQEVVDRIKDMEGAEGELAISKSNLVAAMGYDPEWWESDLVDVEPIGNVLNVLLPRSNAYFEAETHPQVKSLEHQQRASNLAAKSTIAQYYPEVSLNGSATYDYPNLGQDDTIQQNKLMLSLGVPILEWGSIAKEARSQKRQARSAFEQKNQIIIDLSRDVWNVRENIQTDKDLRIADREAVRDAVEVAYLSFESYKAGRIIFLDVQRANVKELAAKVDAARNDADLAMQISKLLALAESGGLPCGSQGAFNDQETFKQVQGR